LALLALVAACSAHAQIALRASSSASAASGTTIAHVNAGGAASRNNCGSINPSIPAGANGDLLIALVNARENGATVTMAGWTEIYGDTYPGSVDLQAHIYWRFASGGDPNTVTQTGTCSSLGARIARFQGVDPAQPFETDPIPAGNVVRQTSSNIDTGSQTTTYSQAMLLVAAFLDDNRTVNQPGGWNQSFDSALNLTRDLGISLNYQLQTAAGTTAITNWTLSGGAPRNYGIIFALRPAPAQLTVNVPAGATSGDLMVASIAVRPCSSASGAACTTAVPPPAGWTLVRTVDQTTGGGTGGFGNRLFVYQRAATAAEPPSYDWTISGPPGHAGAAGSIASFIGVDVSNPLAAEAGQATGSALTHDAPSVDTGSVGNTMLVAAFANSSSSTWTAPGGMNEIADLASLAVPDTLGVSLETAYEVRAAAGVTGTRTATQSSPPASDTGTTHLLALRPAPVQFDILSADWALRCPAYPTSVTIIARDAGGNLLPAYANLVNITTSSGNGDWSTAAGSGALNNGVANDGAATYQFVLADGGMVRLNLAMSVATTLTVRVQEASTGYGTTGAPIAFVSDGYTIANDAIQVAGRSQALVVEHRVAPGCGLSTATGHGGTNTVKVWLTLDPAHPVGATLPGATAVSTVNPLPTAEPGANNITLNFGGPGALAPGQAPLTLNTGDVGKYIVNLRDGNSARRGTSAPITTRPFALAIRGDSVASNVQHGTNETSALMVDTNTGATAAAGDNFTLTVAAYLWASGDDTAPADGLPDTAVSVADNGLAARFAWDTTLSANAVLPGGGTLGAFSLGGAAPTIARASFAGGAARVTTLRYAEVGNVLIRARAANFLNSPGVNVAGDSGMDGAAGGGHVGRFRPKQFALDTGAPPTLTNRAAAACAPASSFTYLNESLLLTLRLVALNAQGAITQNYVGAYARQDLSAGNPAAAFGLGARSGTSDLSARITSVYQGPTPAWANGVLDLGGASGVLAQVRRRSPDDPDGPFSAVQFGIAPAEPDGVPMNVLDLDADNNAANERKNLGVSTELRFGRLRMQNAVGSEKLPLPVPIETQYWNGAGFVTNPQDSCTRLARSVVVLGSYTGTLDPAGGNCRTLVQQDPIAFMTGVGTITLAPPAVSGSVSLTPNLGVAASGSYCDNATSGEDPATAAARSYLLGRWNDALDPDSDPSTAYDDNPSARAAFGLFGSQPNNFIYFRENY
jgi:hypothetical protein